MTSEWTNETLLYKNISLSLLLVWEIDGETYTQRGDFFLFHIFSREPVVPTLAASCKPHRQRRPNPLIGFVSLARLPILCTLSKSYRVVITWFPSGYTPVRPDCPNALSSPCLLITTWQLLKAHEVTRNESKIHVICYITRIQRAKK